MSNEDLGMKLVKKEKFGIIGHVGHGSTVVEALKTKGIDVIVVGSNPPETDETFVLNGVRYAPIKTELRKRKHVASKLSGILHAASMIYMPYMDELNMYGESRYERKLPEGTDIVKEFGLIQLKQSKLSRWNGDMVVNIFEINFSRVDNTL